MLNLTIPPQVNTTSSDSTLTNNADVSANNSPENDQFNKILAKETDRSTNTANNKTAPAETTPAEQNNAKTPPQTPENASKLSQQHAPKKITSLELEQGSDTPALNTEEQPASGDISPLAPIISMPATLPINESIVHVASNPGQTTASTVLNTTLPASDQSMQQGSSRHPFFFNTTLNNGQHTYGAANSATFDQILPPRTDAASITLTRIDESIKLSSSEFTQPGGINNLSSTTASTLFTSSASSTTSMSQNLGIDTLVGQPKWGGELAQKVVWLSSQQQQVAEIRLNPAHLGPVEVMLNINSDQATAQFVSSHLAVREAIEASLPRLREMMAENGITLSDVSVGAESFQQQADTQQNNEGSSGHGYDSNLSGMNDESINKTESSIPLNRHNGIVNTFA